MSYIIPAYGQPSGLSKSLRSAVGVDTVRNVWVFFNDKSQHGNATPLSDRAKLRRRQAGFVNADGDRPVDARYIKEIERRGGRLRHTFDWENAASFSLHSSRFEEVASLPFVKSVMPVAVYVRRDVAGDGLSKSHAARSYGGYGWHMDMVNIPQAHEYLRIKGLGDPGNGVLSAFFDSGFRLTHAAYARIRNNKQVVAAYDFVDGDTTVFDPDSVNNDPAHRYYRSDKHGTQCFGLVGGYHPGSYIGAAWGGSFMLARTEDSPVETKIEEDNWAAAVMWAEANGADIISSSLGYRDGFDFPDTDYDYTAMDGATTIVSKAAAGAVARDVIVVNSMGNEGNAAGSIVAPADVDGVVAVGAVGTSGWVARFSSFGPTSDGRIKPDVAAPGISVPVIDPYSGNLASYTIGDGTSFAAPIVSGIAALIKQAHPGISADSVRARLYNSCRLSPDPSHTGRDNRYGYGIPNAVRAIMKDDEIFVKLIDSAGVPLQGATVETDDSTHTASTEGCVIIRVRSQALPTTINITYRGKTMSPLIVAASAAPFDTTITFETKPGKGLKVFPNVVKNNGGVKGIYVFPDDASKTKKADAVIRTADGKTVWTSRLEASFDGSAEFEWDCRSKSGKKVVPGVYFMIVRHGGNTVSKKFLIAN